MIEAASGAAKPAAIAAGVTAVTVAPHLLLGVPSDVLLAAFAGALFGLAYTKPESWGKLLEIPPGSRARRLGWLLVRASGLAFTLTAVAVASAWSVYVAPHVPMVRWTGEIPPIPFAGIVAFGGQRLIPPALAAATRWLERRSP